jgi:hypothetical protein
MAIAAITWTLKYSKSRLASRLVLFCIADQLSFHEETKEYLAGWYCWPSVDLISRYTLLSERAVYDALTDLVEIGELVIKRTPGKLSSLYMPLFEASETGTDTPAHSAPLQTAHPCKRRKETPANGALTPANGAKNRDVSLLTREVPVRSTRYVPRAPRAGTSHCSEHNQNQKAKRLDREASAAAEARIGRGPELKHPNAIRPDVVERFHRRGKPPTPRKA